MDIPQSVIKHMEAIIEYNWDDELDDYSVLLDDLGITYKSVVEYARQDIANDHIFIDLVKVADFLDRQKGMIL